MQAGYPKIQFVFIVVLCTHKNVTSIKKLAFLLLFSRASKSAPIESKAWRESSIAWLAARGFCRCFGGLLLEGFVGVLVFGFFHSLY